MSFSTKTDRNSVIPDVMKQYRQWCTWDYKVVKGKATKFPTDLSGFAMSWGNQDNWLSFEDVAPYDKIGWFLTLEAGVIMVDFDGCRDPESGVLDPYVEELINRANTYAEFSPSLTGIKMALFGKIPNDHRIASQDVPWKELLAGITDHIGIEVYAHSRFMTLTGMLVPGCPTEIREAPEVLHELVVRFSEPPKEQLNGHKGMEQEAWDAWCNSHLEIVEATEDGWIITCPWVEEHTTAGDTARVWYGPPHTFHCFHAHCQGRKWRDVREKYEPGAYARTYTVASDDPNEASIDIWDCYKEQEWGDAKLFAHMFRGHVVYDHSDKGWNYFMRHYWAKDQKNHAPHLVAEDVGNAYLEAGESALAEAKRIPALTDEEKKEGKEDKRKADIQNAELLIERARKIMHRAKIANILSLANSLPGMSVVGTEWDQDPDVLGCPNGVIDLATGELREGRPGDYIRTITRAEYKGLHEPCPNFEKFLEDLFQDRTEEDRKAIIGFLKRVFGYAISGHSNQRIFPTLWGENGGNGKSTLIRVLSYVLGDIYHTLHEDALIANRGRATGAAQPYLAELQGKRLAVSCEVNDGQRFNVAQINKLTGNDQFSARKNYENMRTITPTHTILLLCNHRPHADATEAAFWSRVKLIPFNMSFIENPDPDNPLQKKANPEIDKDLKKEASGILAWCVQGYLDYLEQGMNVPQCIKDATDEYRKAEDVLEDFAAACCDESDKEATTGALVLYNKYREWWPGQSHLKPMDNKEFGKRAAKRWERKKTKRSWVYVGVSLLKKEDEKVTGDGSDGSFQNFPENSEGKQDQGNHPPPTTDTNLEDETKIQHQEKKVVAGDGSINGGKDETENSRNFGKHPFHPSPATSGEETWIE